MMDWFGLFAIVMNTLIAIYLAYADPNRSKKIYAPFWQPSQFTIIFILLMIFLAMSSISFINQSNDKKMDDMKSSTQGVLQPSSASVFSNNYNKDPIMEIGDSGVAFNWSGPINQPLFKIFADTPLIISKDNGQIKISTNIRDRDGSVAVLANNEWLVNPGNYLDRNYNKNSLEVKDNNNDVVLQVRVLSDRIQFQGKFYDEYGNGLALVGRKDWGAAVIEFTGSNYPKLESSIEPIFMDNSELHFGEIRRSPEITSQLAFYNLSGPIVNPHFKINGKSTGGGGEIIIINKYMWNKTEGHVLVGPGTGWIDPTLLRANLAPNV